MRDVELAWELAGLVGNHLTAAERNHIYVAIGAGDTFNAIELLMQAVVVGGVAVQGELVARLQRWLQGYAHHPQGPRLRWILREAKTAVCDPPPETRRAGSLGTARPYRRPGHP